MTMQKDDSDDVNVSLSIVPVWPLVARKNNEDIDYDDNNDYRDENDDNDDSDDDNVSLSIVAVWPLKPIQPLPCFPHSSSNPAKSSQSKMILTMITILRWCNCSIYEFLQTLCIIYFMQMTLSGHLLVLKWLCQTQCGQFYPWQWWWSEIEKRMM